MAVHAHDATGPGNRRPHRRRPRSGGVIAAPKKVLRGIEDELGVYSQGGNGATSRKASVEIRERCDRLAIDSGPLIYASRMAANVDSAAVQDGYQLYHHAFFFPGGLLCRWFACAEPSRQCWLPTLILVAAEHQRATVRSIANTRPGAIRLRTGRQRRSRAGPRARP